MSFEFEINEIEGKIRVGQLRLGYKELTTPYWSIIQTERKRLIRGLNLIDYSIPSINMLEIIFDYKEQDEIRKLLSDNQLIEDLKNKIQRESRRDSENIFQFRSSSNIKLKSSDLNKLIKIQADSECLSVITIPDPIVGESGIIWESIMDSALKNAKNYVDTENAYIFMPIVSLNQPKKVVKRKIYWLIRKKVRAIGLRAVGTFIPRLQLATDIINKSKNDLWVHLFDLNKKYLQISQMHLAPLAGIDTISIKKGYARRRFPQKTIDTGDFPEPEGIPLDADIEAEDISESPGQPKDLFEGRALGFLSESEQISNFGHELNCSCPICRRAHYSADELIALLSQQDRKSLLQVHEYFAFPNELNSIQRAVHNNNIEDYFDSKTLINLNKKKIFQRYPLKQKW